MDIQIKDLINKRKFDKGARTDRQHAFGIVYIKEIDTYVMYKMIPWIITYDRYFRVDKEDVDLYNRAPKRFYEKYKNELTDGVEAFTERFIGSDMLRDYDVISESFLQAYPSANGNNAFTGYDYRNGVLCARIEWRNNTVYIPPVQIDLSGGFENRKYPLRNGSTSVEDRNGKTICYTMNYRRCRTSSGEEIWLRK